MKTSSPMDATNPSSTCQSHLRMHLKGNHQVEGEVPDDGLREMAVNLPQGIIHIRVTTVSHV